MTTFYYLRKSSITQRYNQQEISLPKGVDTALIFKDQISGATPFAERPEAKRLMDTAKRGDTIIVQHLDRLGRNPADMHLTLQTFTEMGVNIRIAKLKLESLNDDLTDNLSFRIVFGILAVLAEYERIQLAERRSAGIKAAKENNVYKGRTKGTTESPERFLAKHQSLVDIIKNDSKTGNKHTLVQLMNLVNGQSMKAGDGYKVKNVKTVMKVKQLMMEPKHA